MNSFHREGTVANGSLCEPLVGVRITHRNSEGCRIGTKFSDAYGKWSLENLEKDHRVEFSLNKHMSKNFPADRIPTLVRLLEDNLIGYQKRLWFQPGETISVYVHSSSPYTARLFRHGFGKIHILDLGQHPAHLQQIPDQYFVAFGLDWHVSFSYTVPETAQPGIYSLLLEADRSDPFAIPFIVSTRPCSYGQYSPILVLASTNTWQSYNIWGGRSRYRNFEENRTGDFIELSMPLTKRIRRTAAAMLPDSVRKYLNRRIAGEKIHPEWMFRPLSIKRPFPNCALEECDPFGPFTNHLAAGEWRLLAWLEREGYDYDIVSGYELHHDPDLLRNYRCIIFNTHCEYWTREMYWGLKNFHEEMGGWILNLSGNSIFREIEFLEDGSTRCVSLSFQKSCADESQILGVRFTMEDYSTCAPYRVLKPAHWIFESVPLSNSRLFGGASLNQNTTKKYDRYNPGRPGVENCLDGLGASGWETDKLSTNAPADIEVVAKGLNKGGGADMVMRNPAGKRGGMFSASSILFSGCLLIDHIASQMVKNVLKKAIIPQSADRIMDRFDPYLLKFSDRN